MLKNSFFYRVYASYVVVILITALSIGFFLVRNVEKNTLAEIENSLQLKTLLLEQVVMAKIASKALLEQGVSSAEKKEPEKKEGEKSELQRTIESLAQNLASRLTVINASGVVVSDSKEQALKMDNHAQRPEIVEAQHNEFGTITRYSATLNVPMRYMAKQVKKNNQVLAYVRVSISLKEIDEKIEKLKIAILFGALIAAFLGLIIGFYFAQRFTKPIISIAEKAMAIAQGNYEQRIWVRRNDEVGRLADSFNFMAKESAKRVEQLTADKNKLATIFSGMVEGVVAVDQDQKIIHINEAAAKMLGVSVAASIGVLAWQVIRLSEINKVVLKVLDGQEVVRETVHIASASQDLVVDLYCGSIIDNDANNGAILVMHDVSELHRLEKIRKDFVANASHELKTPITVIRGAVETILDDKEMPSEVLYQFLNKANLQIGRLSDIVSDLLALSRLETANNTPQHGVILNDLLWSSLQSYQAVAAEKNIDLRSDVRNKNVKIMGDEQSLRQVLDNLLDNAIKYTPECGTVSVVLTSKDGNAIFMVSDNGVGISKHDQSRIFERFYRVDKVRSRGLGGTGLGLAIVKHIAEQHGGQIEVKSDAEKGSTFILTLPLVL